MGSKQIMSYQLSSWETFTNDCPNGDICWYQISSSSSTQDTMIVVGKFLLPDFVEDEDNRQSVQWQHPEGYQGYVRFRENYIESMEIRFPSNLLAQQQIFLGDVILSLGEPDTLEYGAFGQVLLHYHDLFLTIYVRIGAENRLDIHQPIVRLQMISPYRAIANQTLSTTATSSTLSHQQKWDGFGRFSQNP